MRIVLQKYNRLKKTYLFTYSLFIFTVTGIVAGCGNGENLEQNISKEFEGKREAVSIALPETPPNWLTVIAVEQGFFSKNGLDVTIKYYPSGKRALLGMFDGVVDIASVARVPVVFNSFERQDFSIIATIGSSSNDNKIAARKDRGIQKPDDLKGKLIATQKASAAHFFLYLFLLKNNILEREVEFSFMKVEELPGALERGEVDAISTREPFLSKAVDLLEGKVVVLEEPGLYHKSFVMAAFNNFIENKPHVIRRILRAMIKAEEFVREHPRQAVTSISRKLNISETVITDVLSVLKLDVRLDQALAYALRNEARWLIENKLTDKTGPPNYLDFIYLNALKHVKPESVTIIH